MLCLNPLSEGYFGVKCCFFDWLPSSLLYVHGVVSTHSIFFIIKEKVAETAKLQQQHHAEFTTAEQVSDKRKSKAAVHLESRVERLIKEMDTMVDKLDDKRQKLLRDIEIRANHIKDSIEEEEQSKMIDAIKADHQRVVDMNDLLESLKRIQSVHDHKRWEKILKVLDEDKDGKIELKHILSVIELLGEGNVKVSSKEITRILEMIDNEELANAISLESELKADKSSSSASVENSTQVPLKQKNNNNKDDSERSKREDN
ncbi:unnamed protein product [Trichobilharzia regenti]|nr:unnamed protein product [Trichobilharzia regenti]